MSCAGTPIRNLLNGRLEGIIDLTTRRTDANLLMPALAQEAAAEIEQRLIQQSSEREQALLREFLAANRRTAQVPPPKPAGELIAPAPGRERYQKLFNG